MLASLYNNMPIIKACRLSCYRVQKDGPIRLIRSGIPILCNSLKIDSPTPTKNTGSKLINDSLDYQGTVIDAARPKSRKLKPWRLKTENASKHGVHSTNLQAVQKSKGPIQAMSALLNASAKDDRNTIDSARIISSLMDGNTPNTSLDKSRSSADAIRCHNPTPSRDTDPLPSQTPLQSIGSTPSTAFKTNATPLEPSAQKSFIARKWPISKASSQPSPAPSDSVHAIVRPQKPSSISTTFADTKSSNYPLSNASGKDKKMASESSPVSPVNSTLKKILSPSDSTAKSIEVSPEAQVTTKSTKQDKDEVDNRTFPKPVRAAALAAENASAGSSEASSSSSSSGVHGVISNRKPSNGRHTDTVTETSDADASGPFTSLTEFGRDASHDEVTVGEIMYERRQVHLDKKRKEFVNRVLDPETKRDKWNRLHADPTPASKKASDLRQLENKLKITQAALNIDKSEDTSKASDLSHLAVVSVEVETDATQLDLGVVDKTQTPAAKFPVFQKPPTSGIGGRMRLIPANDSTRTEPSPSQSQPFQRSEAAAKRLEAPGPWVSRTLSDLSGDSASNASNGLQIPSAQISGESPKQATAPRLQTKPNLDNRIHRLAPSSAQILYAVSKDKTHSGQRTVVKSASIPAKGLSLRELSSKLSMKVADVAKKLTALGEKVAAPDGQMEEYAIEADVAELLVMELGLEVKREKAISDGQLPSPSLQPGQRLLSRAPLICVMGHVDHGKTTLLDKLRSASVAASEAGGITQSLSAFRVLTNNRSVVFLDTPGHAAFASMRANGASATDIVVLVVAMDDGLRPQTVEALKTAQAANCPIVIALNKIDKLPSQSERADARRKILTQLTEFDVIAEDFGGDVQVVEVSAVTGEGLDGLKDSLLLQADLLNLDASYEGQAEAIVLEVGDIVIIGSTYGRVKVITDDKGKSVKSATPSSPVRITGLRAMPKNGEELLSVDSEDKAREITERRERIAQMKLDRQDAAAQAAKLAAASTTVTFPSPNQTPPGMRPKRVNSITASAAATAAAAAAAARMPVSNTVTIDVLLKADGIGPLQALQTLVKDLAARTTDLEVRIVSSGIGDVTRSDIDLAASSTGAVVLCFNVGVADSATRSAAKEQDVRVVQERIIYRLEDALKEVIMASMPRIRVLHSEGTAKVLKIFSLNTKDPTTVAGSAVTSGYLRHGPNIVYTIRRGGAVVKAEVPSRELKRFKDTVSEVGSGNECGLTLADFHDLCEGDEVECIRVEWKTKEFVVAEVNQAIAYGT